jgi:hypothetical protein
VKAYVAFRYERRVTHKAAANTTPIVASKKTVTLLVSAVCTGDANA